MSLQNGLTSYEARLGADIIIVPNQARSHGSIESILLQGIPGYFYMDDSILEKARNTEGVEIATPQFYLASASAGCCSVSVQVIGFDPETDFIVQEKKLYIPMLVIPSSTTAELISELQLYHGASLSLCEGISPLPLTVSTPSASSDQENPSPKLPLYMCRSRQAMNLPFCFLK